MPKRPKRPRDLNQWAKQMVDLATGKAQEPTVPASDKNPAAVALGRIGGLKGGKTHGRRSAITAVRKE